MKGIILYTYEIRTDLFAGWKVLTITFIIDASFKSIFRIGMKINFITSSGNFSMHSPIPDVINLDDSSSLII